jgi:hypothetical protein
MASLRDSMPATAQAIDELREVFGAELVNAQIRQALKGRPAIYAEELVDGKVVTFGVKPQAMKEFPASFLECKRVDAAASSKKGRK